MSAARDNAALAGAEVETAALYRRYERPLRAWLGRRVTAPPALVEDACASAWLILVAKRPVCGERIFGWLSTTALHEAYRLLRLQRREQPGELGEGKPALVLARRDDPETALEAKRALMALGSLRERERRYLALKAAGHSYREIAAIAGTGSTNNVNKHLVRGRDRLRQLADEASERPAPGSEKRGGLKMVTGSCRRCGLRPRRVLRGSVEPLCEECHRQALDKVRRELADEARTKGRAGLRKLKLVHGARSPDGSPEPVPMVRTRPLSLGAGPSGHPGRPPRCISEELLGEARRLYERGLSMGAVAETLLEHTGYANAHSAEVALRRQFKRRGWPLRTRAEAQAVRTAPGGEDLPRAA